ncbi:MULTISPECIES: hypothetical protein [Stenotrophomonas]|uniref:hypothetical protein n=1 Tax=Stenotrophomonas TaxID=40323 RepID=UPI000ADD40AC|nr:hypothetical protein [Stenotrophomonas maltophilia]
MKTAVLISVGVLGMLPLLAALHMLLASHFAPSWLARLNNGAGDPDGGKGKTALTWIYFIAAVAGFGIMAYAGTYAVLWWLPNSFGFVDEEGGFSPIRGVVATFIALWVGFHLPSLICRSVDR